MCRPVISPLLLVSLFISLASCTLLFGSEDSSQVEDKVCEEAVCPANACGTFLDDCGNSVACGKCAEGTCGGGGTANQCGLGACAARTCAELEVECGTVSDECGDVLDCGRCNGLLRCGGGGEDNVCGCTPTTCEDLDAQCGPVSDGCGNTLQCGDCGAVAGTQCGGGGTPNQCGVGPCLSKSCSDLNAECGAISDGCSTTLDCGMCAGEFDTCQGGGQNNTCGCTPTTCDAQAASCGIIVDGCGNDIACGSCAIAESCTANACICDSPCGPQQLAIGKPKRPTGIAVDDQYIYWANTNSNAIVRKAKTGEDAEILIDLTGEGRPRYLAVDATHLYWTSNRGVFRSLKDGTSPSTLHGGASFGIALDGEYVYWGKGSTSKFVTYRKSDEEVTVISMATNNGATYDVAQTANAVYWGNFKTGEIMRYSKGTGDTDGAVTVFADGQSEPIGIVADSEYVYWTNSLSNTVMRKPVAGDADPVKFAESQSTPWSITMDATHVYWTNSLSGQVMRRDKTALSAPQILVEQTGSTPKGLAVDDTQLYWSTHKTNLVQSLARCSCNNF